MTPAIFALSGPSITTDEAALFRAANPVGYILFGRNIIDADQLRAMTDALRDLAGRDLPILIDQEGGPVARLRPPHWPEFPAATVFDHVYDAAPARAMTAARANAAALGVMLRGLGITVNAMPMLDVRQPDAHAIITNRSYGAEPMRVAALGRAVIDGLASAGVAGIIKHMPGQGRGTSDSHLTLPRVTASAEALESDLAPFRTLAAREGAGRVGFGMTAHVVYEAWDAERPATLSPVVIGDVIRRQIGFDGFLMTDGLEMQALSGSMAERARAAVDAGVDAVLHCTGDLAEMHSIADTLGDAMAPDSEARLARAMDGIAAAPSAPSSAHAFESLLAQRDALLAVGDGAAA